MGIKQGDKLAYVILDNTMVIKPIRMPSVKEFKESLDEVQEWAESVSYTEKDANNIIKSNRVQKRQTKASIPVTESVSDNLKEQSDLCDNDEELLNKEFDFSKAVKNPYAKKGRGDSVNKSFDKINEHTE